MTGTAERRSPGTVPESARPDAEFVAWEQQVLHERLLTARRPVGPDAVDAADVADAVLLSCGPVRAARHAGSVPARAPRLAGTPRAQGAHAEPPVGDPAP